MNITNSIFYQGASNRRMDLNWDTFHSDYPISLFKLSGCSNLVIENGIFTGSGPSLTALPNDIYCALVELCGVNDRITFRRCVFRDGPNHGVAHLYGDRTSTNTTFEDCLFENGGNYSRDNPLIWDGAAIAIGGVGTRIIRCQIKNWLRGVEQENPYSAATLLVDGCHIEGCFNHAIMITPTALNPQIDNGPLFRSIIRDTTIIGGKKRSDQWAHFSMSGVFCQGTASLLVDGCDISRIDDGIGVLADASWGSVSNVRIVNNHIHDCGREGITVCDGVDGKKLRACGAIIQGNDIHHNGGNGIVVRADEVLCTNNRITDHPYPAMVWACPNGICEKNIDLRNGV